MKTDYKISTQEELDEYLNGKEHKAQTETPLISPSLSDVYNIIQTPNSSFGIVSAVRFNNTNEDNEKSDKELQLQIQDKYLYRDIRGSYTQDNGYGIRYEDSVLIFGISKSALISLGIQNGQHSVLYKYGAEFCSIGTNKTNVSDVLYEFNINDGQDLLEFAQNSIVTFFEKRRRSSRKNEKYTFIPDINGVSDNVIRHNTSSYKLQELEPWSLYKCMRSGPGGDRGKQKWITIFERNYDEVEKRDIINNI